MSDTIRISKLMRERIEIYRNIRIKEYERMEMWIDVEEFKEMNETEIIDAALFEIIFLKGERK